MMISKSKNGIPILLNDKLLRLNVRQWEVWEPTKAPHMIIVGSTGSGKTYFSKLLLGKIALHSKQVEMYISDFKGDTDFSFLSGCKNFYRFEECSDGLDQFYKLFLDRQKNLSSARTMLIYYIDEWQSFLGYMDKKDAEDKKRKLSTLLALGRSFNVHVIVSQQRADAQYFSTARDNFSVAIGLGTFSPESQQMLFHDYKDQMENTCRQGTGYMLTNGMDLKRIVVPTVSNMNKLHNTIRTVVDSQNL